MFLLLIHGQDTTSAESGQGTVVLPRDLLVELEPAAAAAAAMIKLILDLHVRMRVVIISRVERSLGFNDLHDDPNIKSQGIFLVQGLSRKEERDYSTQHQAKIATLDWLGSLSVDTRLFCMSRDCVYT